MIVFDEVQLCPKARQAIKKLVKDGRYDYIETGSLISIKKNVKDILIPSEERRLPMYPMDFEEFLWAKGDNVTNKLLLDCFNNNRPLGDSTNRRLLKEFRLYMLVGGMPKRSVNILRLTILDLLMKLKEIFWIYILATLKRLMIRDIYLCYLMQFQHNLIRIFLGILLLR